jgi:hypothetical protein
MTLQLEQLPSQNRIHWSVFKLCHQNFKPQIYVEEPRKHFGGDKFWNGDFAMQNTTGDDQLLKIHLLENRFFKLIFK